ncbi:MULTISPECIES: 2,3-dihydro-2,3-dihydroxybenzoate dehydrogenase [Xenorhabdus]|uniref:2,3-dihydro-2,3-dihydroxybenzoate dehydrogenase n=1 Tax=Xenorhabdus TaxID=626 RepID=UPI00064A7C29|nr:MULTISPECIES: 2,3-dihydro-2,3-dihydroxybenzoate dehydrogenase [Xenorhabdus]KLU15097.1 2,3-dihydroxybenzoate-2,3-dehydrogenase [Xenorhabdus griffiniae]KOP31833.1 2,3-dihydroxybenzoate-2,3-dehydrogenase [Xenorhabdus sp. GDc328]WFQ81258.1 2,3-dihydro-2,3-dihydroxybenzoate dehydrogenase [Xenorhabdus sp. SF857]
MTFDKKYVAVITGACGGIGEAIARRLAIKGITLALIDKQAEALQPLVDKLRYEYPQSIIGFPVDVTEPQQVDSAFLAIRNQLGPIGYLVNGAGVLHHASVENTDIDGWNRSFAVNATGVFNVSKAAVGYMKEQKKGSIVTVASNAARVPRAMMAAYCASKAAAQAFTYALGLEVAPFGIRCNVVAPGSTDTPMLRSMWGNEADKNRTLYGNPEQFRIGIPLHKIAAPDEIAAAICFYLSEESSQTTLSTLLVDGGAALGSC